MILLSLATILSVFVSYALAYGRLYQDHKVIKAHNVTREGLMILNQMDVDVWKVDLRSHSVILRADAALYELLRESRAFRLTVLNENLQQTIDGESQRLAFFAASVGADWFQDYHPYDEIYDWFENIAAEHPDIAKFVPSIGKTYHRRDIFAIHITSSKVGTPKPQIWLQSLQHAREWIGGSVIQYIANELIAGYDKNAAITALLDAVELVIIPIVNPDGYAYTWSHDRLWRKNRSMPFGVDLNRNWDDHWGYGGGSSGNPLSETYHGPHAASEAEIKALQAYFLKQENILGVLDFHCFSQLILRPYGYKGALARHDDQHAIVAMLMAAALQQVDGRKYSSIASHELYPSSGSSTDWFYGDDVFSKLRRRPYSLAVELPPDMSSAGAGFILDPSEINSVGKEAFAALLEFITFVIANPLS